jgi:hypothetical protein
MAKLVDQDVAIVPVLDLQEVRDNGVRSHALDEAVARLLEFLASCVAILRKEMLK